MKIVIIVDLPSDNDALLTATEKMLRTFYQKVIIKPMPMKRKSAVDWLHHESQTVIKTHEPSEIDQGWNLCVEYLESEEE